MTFTLLIAGMVAGFLTSCGDNSGHRYEDYLIQVDSVKIPGHIDVDDTLAIEFYGTVGTNGCYRFSEFVTKRKGNEIFIEVWGEHNVSSGVACPTVMVYLEGETFYYTFKESGDYTFKIVQPGGDYLVRQVTADRIEESDTVLSPTVKPNE